MKGIYKIALLISLMFFSITGQSESIDIADLKKQAMAGDIKAQFKLGTMYDWGRDVERSYSETLKWYTMAAKNGFAEAQNSLGSAYQAEKNFIEAKKWYQLAPDQDHALGTNNLANLYDLGLGVTQNRQKGFELYTKSANLGWPEAMWNIANMYGAGQLGEKDLYKACIWTFRSKKYSTKSQVRLNKYLSDIFPYLEKTLGDEQFSKCKTEANKWSPNKDKA